DPLVDAALGEDARPAYTGLPRVDEGAERSHRDGQVEVGVVEDHHRCLAAEFGGDLVEFAVGGGTHDRPTYLRRTGEGDLLHIGVRGDRRSGGVAVTVHQVDHAL